MKSISSLHQFKESVKSSMEKVSSYPEDIISKWMIGRKNFP